MYYPLSRREMSDLRRTNSEYAEVKLYMRNKDEYELETHLYEIQRSHSLDNVITPLERIPRHLERECNIPQDIEPPIELLAHSYGIDYLGAIKMLLCAISMAIWGRLFITPKESWDEPGILQTIGIGESGTMKSSLLKKIAHPFRQFEQDRAVSEEQRALSKAKQKFGEKFIRNIEKTKLREAIKTAVQSDPAAVLEQLMQFASENAQFQIDANKELASTVQVSPCLILDTATPMGLAKHLKKHGECANIMSAEADFIKKVILNSSADTGLLLRGATQEQYVRLSGNATNEIRLERPSINMLVMSQYSVAEKLYRNEDLNDIGLTARLMPHFFNSSYQREELNATAMEEYNSKIKKLLDMYYTQDCKAEHFAVKLTSGAIDSLNEFEKEINDIIENKTMPASATPWLRKACGLSLKYALAYHAWRCTIPHTPPITEDEMRVGIEIVRNSLPHVEFALGPMGLCALNTAQKIIDNIRNRTEDERLKLNQIWDSTLIQQRIGRKAVEVNNALQLLESCHWIILHDDGSKNLKFMLHNNFFGRRYR